MTPAEAKLAQWLLASDDPDRDAEYAERIICDFLRDLRLSLKDDPAVREEPA